MNKTDIRRNAYEIIYLVSCVINGNTPETDKIKEFNLEQLYEVCHKHNITAVTAYALESAGIFDKRFEQDKAKSIRKNILLDEEREKLLARLEQEKIWYMPLKGAYLKDLYPQIGMRQMSDNDILFDGFFRKKVRSIMIDMGFACKEFKEGLHDVYHKEPIYNFEMHVLLFSKYYKLLYEYYENVKNRLVRDAGRVYGYHFSPEDFYLYMIAHEYRHYSQKGTGLKSLLDTYVYIKKLEGALDWDYINGETEKLGISEFERSNRELALRVFGGHKLTNEEEELLDYYLLSGTYGTQENLVKLRLKELDDKTGKRSNLAYVVSRIFPDVRTMTRAVPFVDNNPLLYPAGFVVRAVRGLTVKRRRLINEYTILKKTIDEDAE